MVALAFVGFIVLFFALDYLFIRDLEAPVRPKSDKTDENDSKPVDEVVIPRGYFFHPGHSWVHILESGEAAVGIDDLVQAAVGPATGIELPRPGESIRAGQPVFRMVVGGRALDFASPLTGTVLRLNLAIEKEPGAIHADPYGQGWLFSVAVDPGQIALPRDEIAVAWMKSEIARLSEFIAVYRKGLSFRGMLNGANDQVWTMFQEGFLGPQAPKEA